MKKISYLANERTRIQIGREMDNLHDDMLGHLEEIGDPRWIAQFARIIMRQRNKLSQEHRRNMAVVVSSYDQEASKKIGRGRTINQSICKIVVESLFLVNNNPKTKDNPLKAKRNVLFEMQVMDFNLDQGPHTAVFQNWPRFVPSMPHTPENRKVFESLTKGFHNRLIFKDHFPEWHYSAFFDDLISTMDQIGTLSLIRSEDFLLGYFSVKSGEMLMVSFDLSAMLLEALMIDHLKNQF